MKIDTSKSNSGSALPAFIFPYLSLTICVVKAQLENHHSILIVRVWPMADQCLSGVYLLRRSKISTF